MTLLFEYKMNEVNITISIAGRDYKLTIKNEDEEIVRNAQKIINQTIRKYSDAYDYNDMQDLLAMVVIQNTVNAIKLEKEVAFKDGTLNSKLELIDEILSEVNI